MYPNGLGHFFRNQHKKTELEIKPFNLTHLHRFGPVFFNNSHLFRNMYPNGLGPLFS